MTAFDFDLGVVGAGPAGATCALTAARLGASVVLIEPCGTVFDKPCGEGIMAAGVAVLADLGLRAQLGRAREFDRLRYVLADVAPLEIELSPPGLAVERPLLLAAFEAALAHERNVVRVRAHAATSAIEGLAQDHGHMLALGRSEELRVRVLVAADGSGGHSAPWLRGRRRERRSSRFGVRARFEQDAQLDGVEVHLGGGCEVYLTPLANGAINVAVLFEKAPDGVRGSPTLLAHALERHPRAALHLRRAITAPTARALDRARPRDVAGRRSFLVGDAAGAIDPILGCGVSLALTGGMRAAHAAVRILEGNPVREVEQVYRRAWNAESRARRILANALRAIAKSPHTARLAIAALRRSPRSCRVLARIAAGNRDEDATLDHARLDWERRAGIP